MTCNLSFLVGFGHALDFYNVLINSQNGRFAPVFLVVWSFPVGRVCSATSQVYFQSAEFVPPRPGSNSGRQSTSRDDYRTAGGVPPRPGSISSWQRVFRHVPGRFLVGRICSATSQANFRSAEFVPPRSGSIFGRQRVFRHVLVDFRSAECVPPRPGSIVGH